VGLFHTVKANRKEAEILSGVDIMSEDALKRAAAVILEKGAGRLYITLGRGGAYYADASGDGIIRPAEIIEDQLRGVGDLYTAALTEACLKRLSTAGAAEYAAARVSTEIADLRLSSPDFVYFAQKRI
jgi:pseudouridine kinase